MLFLTSSYFAGHKANSDIVAIKTFRMSERKQEDVEKTEQEHVSPPISSQASTYGPGQEQPGGHGAAIISAKLKNPLAGLTREELLADVDAFAKEKDLEDITPLLKKGALVSQNPKDFEQVAELDEMEREWLRQEKSHRWNQPKMLYFMTGKSIILLGQS